MKSWGPASSCCHQTKPETALGRLPCPGCLVGASVLGAWVGVLRVLRTLGVLYAGTWGLA